MATWVQVDNVSYWSWSHVADLGPYTGTLPLPIPVWIPDDAGEVDFVVGRPHPSGDVARFQDGTYDEGDAGGTYMYNNGRGLFTGRYGGLTTLDPTMHLFVQFYTAGFPSNPTAAPSLAPLALVPAALVSGGYGPTRGAGKWSDWFPGWNTSHNLTHIDSFYGQRSIHTPITATDDTSAIINGQLADLVAGHGTPGEDFFDAPWQQPATFISVDRQGAIPGTGSVFSAISYRGFTIDQANIASGPARGYPLNLPDTAVLAPLDDGMVADENTWSDNDQNVIQYQSGHLTFVDWGQGHVSATPIAALYDSEATVFGGGGSPSFVPSLQDIQLVTGVHSDISTTPESTIWGIKNRGPDDISWGSLAHRNAGNSFGLGIIPNADIVANGQESLHGLVASVYGPNAPYSSAGTVEPLVYEDTVAPDVWTAPVDLPGVTASRFSVIVLPSLGGRDDGFISTDAVAGEITQVYSFAALWRGVVVNGFETDFYPIMHTPPWRYWISGELVFHCPPGYSPKVTTVEGRWSDWQPGYLVDTLNDGNAVATGIDADRKFMARVDFRTRSSSTSIADAISLAMADIAAGVVDSTANPGAVGNSFIDTKYWKTGGLYYANVGVGYEGVVVAPSTNYLPSYYSSAARPALLDTLTEGVDFAVIPDSVVSQMHHASLADAPVYYVDWEAPASSWQHWTERPEFRFELAVDHFANVGDASPPAPWHGSTTLDGRFIALFGVDLAAPISATGESFSPSLGPPRPTSGIIAHGENPGFTLFVTQDTSRHYLGFTTANVGVEVFYPGGPSALPASYSCYIYPNWPVSAFPELSPLPYPPEDLLDEVPYSGGLTLVQHTSEGLDGIIPWGLYRSPRWRYWIPTRTTHECVIAGAVRMTQRNDGLGVSRHPRLHVGNAPSSQQLNRSARVNRGNTYT